MTKTAQTQVDTDQDTLDAIASICNKYITRHENAIDQFTLTMEAHTILDAVEWQAEAIARTLPAYREAKIILNDYVRDDDFDTAEKVTQIKSRIGFYKSTYEGFRATCSTNPISSFLGTVEDEAYCGLMLDPMGMYGTILQIIKDAEQEPTDA